jgi:glycosyltransferase involved in cell wall biosynthesis
LNAVVAATPHIATGYDRRKTVVVQNFPFAGEFHKADGSAYSNRSPVAAYVGGISAVRGAREMLEAAEIVGHDFRVVLAGRFESAAIETESRRSPAWNYVDFRGWVSRTEVAEILDSARMGLVLFHPAPNHMESLPTKLFEYMSAGLPVVASDIPLWRTIIASHNCGILVDPLDPREIARGIGHLLESPEEAREMGMRGREAVLTRFTWESQATELLALYSRLLPENSGAGAS